jgi:hypothetical protein
VCEGAQLWVQQIAKGGLILIVNHSWGETICGSSQIARGADDESRLMVGQERTREGAGE